MMPGGWKTQKRLNGLEGGPVAGLPEIHESESCARIDNGMSEEAIGLKAKKKKNAQPYK